MEAQPSYRLLRIDFTDDQACAFCPNRLTTGIGRVLVDDAGKEVFCRPGVREEARAQRRRESP